MEVVNILSLKRDIYNQKLTTKSTNIDGAIVIYKQSNLVIYSISRIHNCAHWRRAD